MYRAWTKLPPQLSENDALILSEILPSEEETCAVLRENKKDGMPWILELQTQKEVSKTDLTARLEHAAETANLQGIEAHKPGWTVEKIPDIDWLAHSYQSFPPFSVGRFFIHGAHYEGAAPAGRMPLQIDAATAFGSGEHATTEGCLRALLDLKDRGFLPRNILDMGTGSGILGIAAWMLWQNPVLAIDNDHEAVRVARRHQKANSIPEGPADLACMQGEGFASRFVQTKKPFDLILANILAGTLKDMAPDLKNAADKDAYVILSGILEIQAGEVLAIYQDLGFTLRRRLDIGEWSTLVLQNAPS